MEIIKRIFIVSYGLRLRFVFIITDDHPLSSLMDGFCYQWSSVLGGRNALRPYWWRGCGHTVTCPYQGRDETFYSETCFFH